MDIGTLSGLYEVDRSPLVADSDEGGHLFQSDRGHPSDLMAAT
jgi:hypothetical protein